MKNVSLFPSTLRTKPGAATAAAGAVGSPSCGGCRAPELRRQQPGVSQASSSGARARERVPHELASERGLNARDGPGGILLRLARPIADAAAKAAAAVAEQVVIVVVVGRAGDASRAATGGEECAAVLVVCAGECGRVGRGTSRRVGVAVRIRGVARRAAQVDVERADDGCVRQNLSETLLTLR